MVAVISGPDFWRDIDTALKTLNKEIVYKKIDRDIDVISELEKLGGLYIDFVILDISCVEDYRRVPQALRKLRAARENVRVILLAPRHFEGNEAMANLISMGIYDIIGQREYESASILPSLIEHIEKPATYAKAVKWNSGTQTSKNAYTTDAGAYGRQKAQTVEKDKIIGTVVIAVAGTMHRIGTTHTALSLAKYLLDNRHGVALVEMNNSSSFNAIKNAYENVEAKEDMFSLAGIDFYPYNPYASLSDFLTEDYAYIVLDMGVYGKCNLAEFKRAHERIIVSGVKDWEFEELEQILETDDKAFKNKYYFTFSDDAMFEFARQNMEKLPCFQAPYSPQPLQENDKCERVFEAMLKNVLPQTYDRDENMGLLDVILKKNEIALYHKPVLMDKLIKKAEEEIQRSKVKGPGITGAAVAVKFVCSAVIIAMALTFLYYVISGRL